MSTATPGQWYLRTQDGAVFGPASLDDLQSWAADGRVAPEHSVSPDRESWQPAASLADLAMTWTITFDTGSSYGPLNLRALRDYIHDGSVGLDASIRDSASGDQSTVRDRLADIFATPPPPAPAPPVNGGSSQREGEAIAAEAEGLKQAVSDAETRAAEAQAAYDLREAELQQRITDGEGRIATLQAEAQAARETLEQVKTELQQEIADGEAQIAALTDELQASAADGEQLKADMLRLREASDAREAESELALSRVQEDAAGLAEQLGTSRDTVAALETKLQSANARLADGEARIGVLGTELAAIRATADDLTTEKQDLEARIEQETAALSEKVARAEEERGRARGEAEGVEQALRRQQEILHTEQSRARKREKDLDDSLAEQVKLHDREMAAWEEREQNLQRKMGQLQRNCEEALAEAADLRKQLEEETKKQPAAAAAPANSLAGIEAQAQAELKRWMKGK